VDALTESDDRRTENQRQNRLKRKYEKLNDAGSDAYEKLDETHGVLPLWIE